MNKKSLLVKRSKTLNKYGVFGGSYHSKRAKNAIYIHRNPKIVSDEHEIAKFKECLKLAREGKWFITEAWRRGGSKNDIHDIVVLDDEEIIEIETDKKRAERFKNTDITVIKLWEKRR